MPTGSHLQIIWKHLAWFLHRLPFSPHANIKNLIPVYRLLNHTPPRHWVSLRFLWSHSQGKSRKQSLGASWDAYLSLQSMLWEFGDVFSPLFWVSFPNYRVTSLKQISTKATTLGSIPCKMLSWLLNKQPLPPENMLSQELPALPCLLSQDAFLSGIVLSTHLKARMWNVLLRLLTFAQPTTISLKNIFIPTLSLSLICVLYLVNTALCPKEPNALENVQ